jgi:hypothetical protein
MRPRALRAVSRLTLRAMCTVQVYTWVAGRQRGDHPNTRAANPSRNAAHLGEARKIH